MPVVYDHWEVLVNAVLKREGNRELALCPSLSSGSGSSSDDLSFSGPFHTNVVKFSEIKKATGNFRPGRVRRGGRSCIFKGWLHEHTLTAVKPGCGMPVAVKLRTSDAILDLTCRMEELNHLTQVHHPNVVKLIGYCFEEDNLLLEVYEFIPKGSLDMHLFGTGSAPNIKVSSQTALFPSGPKPLSWDIRIKVAVGAARAISFLHDRDIQLHRGFKTKDILLDGNYNAKLYSFVLASVPDSSTSIDSAVHASTQNTGTFSYAAPEYVKTGCLTTKCDVYNFGVVLLELLAGRPVYPAAWVLPTHKNSVALANPHFLDAQKFIRFMDFRLKGQYCPEEAYTVGRLALQCLSPEPNLRPQMVEVLYALEQLL